MEVFTTLTKKCRFEESKWTFGQLPSGWLCAFGPRDKKIFFRNLNQMDSCIDKFMSAYGYHKPAAEMIEQLSLAV